MRIFLVETSTNTILNIYDNVINWGTDFIEYTNKGLKAKKYASTNQYFSKDEPTVNAE